MMKEKRNTKKEKAKVKKGFPYKRKGLRKVTNRVNNVIDSLESGNAIKVRRATKSDSSED